MTDFLTKFINYSIFPIIILKHYCHFLELHMRNMTVTHINNKRKRIEKGNAMSCNQKSNEKIMQKEILQ